MFPPPDRAPPTVFDTYTEVGSRYAGSAIGSGGGTNHQVGGSTGINAVGFTNDCIVKWVVEAVELGCEINTFLIDIYEYQYAAEPDA